MLVLAMMLGCEEYSTASLVTEAHATGGGGPVCDGPMIELDPTYIPFAAFVRIDAPVDDTQAALNDMFSEEDENFVAIANNCDQELTLHLDLDTVNPGEDLGGFSIIDEEDDGPAAGSAGSISAIEIYIPAYETDVRGILYDAFSIQIDETTGEPVEETFPPYMSSDYGWLDVEVVNQNDESIFHAEAALEAIVINMWALLITGIEVTPEPIE